MVLPKTWPGASLLRKECPITRSGPYTRTGWSHWTMSVSVRPILSPRSHICAFLKNFLSMRCAVPCLPCQSRKASMRCWSHRNSRASMGPYLRQLSCAACLEDCWQACDMSALAHAWPRWSNIMPQLPLRCSGNFVSAACQACHQGQPFEKWAGIPRKAISLRCLLAPIAEAVDRAPGYVEDHGAFQMDEADTSKSDHPCTQERHVHRVPRLVCCPDLGLELNGHAGQCRHCLLFARLYPLRFLWGCQLGHRPSQAGVFSKPLQSSECACER